MQFNLVVQVFFQLNFKCWDNCGFTCSYKEYNSEICDLVFPLPRPPALHPMVTSCKNWAQYHNQGAYINIIHSFYPDFPALHVSISLSLSLSLSVYVSVFCAFSSLPFYHMCKFVYQHQSPDTECFHPQRSLVLPFDNHIHFPPASNPSLAPGNP